MATRLRGLARLTRSPGIRRELVDLAGCYDRRGDRSGEPVTVENLSGAAPPNYPPKLLTRRVLGTAPDGVPRPPLCPRTALRKPPSAPNQKDGSPPIGSYRSAACPRADRLNHV